MKKISRRNFLLASGAVTIGAALAACGGSSSTSTASSAPASSAASAAPAAQGKVLNIWCWNDEFQSRFNDYYPEVSEIAADKSTTTLKDGTVVKWTINANENNNYQNKLDEALLSQDSAADDDKIDIFLIEADYALKYVDSDYVLVVVVLVGVDGPLHGGAVLQGGGGLVGCDLLDLGIVVVEAALELIIPAPNVQHLALGGSGSGCRGCRSSRRSSSAAGRTAAAGCQSSTNSHDTGSEQEITTRDLFHKGKPPSWFSIKKFILKNSAPGVMGLC